MNSTTIADAPPPPLQTPATPYFPFLCLSAWTSAIYQNVKGFIVTFARRFVQNRIKFEKNHTPTRVTMMRAPLQPIGWPKETAPPFTFNFSWKIKHKSVNTLQCKKMQIYPFIMLNCYVCTYRRDAKKSLIGQSDNLTKEKKYYYF